MASIFLSYARDDLAKAKTLAKALGRAGHSVWWDRHIDGGAEFSGEIEAALNGSDIVLVLWSETSVRSAWVRDEAAEGRDSGRLVPVMLDGCAPPLGFRQLQSIYLDGWSGRGNPPHLPEILKAVAARGRKDHPVPEAGPKAPPKRRRRPLLVALALFGVLLVAVSGWWLLGGRGQVPDTPKLAVLPFSDLSPQGDKAYFAEGVAEAILTLLAREPGIQVVGRSTAQQLHDAGNDSGKMRRALGITHVLEGSARSVGNQLRMSVRLIDAEDGEQLWAEEYRRRLDNVFAVQDEIGRAVAHRLKGSFAANGRTQQLTTVDAYTLYLAARAKMRDRRMSSLRDALETARQVIAADPNYAPGHALYAELIWQMSPEAYGTIPMARVRELAGPHARRAIQLAPNAPEGYAALGLISTHEDAVRSLTKASELDPARSELRLWLARALQEIGRNTEGLRHLKDASEMDPLFAPVIWNYAWWLAGSRRFDEAEALLADFERRGGSRGVAERTRAEIAGFYRGDYSEGIRALHAALSADPETPLGRDRLAWMFRKVGLFDEASRFAAALPPYSRLAAAGDYQRLAAQARSDGKSVWNHPDAGEAVVALAVARDWSSIERLYDGHPSHSELCMSAVVDVPVPLALAAALKYQGRSADSSRLSNCLEARVAMHGRDPARSADSPAALLDLAKANLYALEGRSAEGFALIHRAINGGVRSNYGRGMAEFPAFDPYRSVPQYRSLDARLKQLIAQDRAEVMRMRSERRRAA